MICQTLALIVFFANTLSSEALQASFGYKTCTYGKLDPTGVYNCPPDWVCKRRFNKPKPKPTPRPKSTTLKPYHVIT